MTTTTDHAFDADTAVEPIADGRYEARLTDRWTALGGTPNGGYMLGVCLRALAAEMPLPDPLVASTFFLRPGAIGTAEVRTELVRSGRRTATGQSTLHQDGREIVRLTATFGDLSAASGRTAGFTAPPALPPPDQARDLIEGGSLPGVSITDQVEYRTAEPPGWARGEPSGDPRHEFWMRFRDGREPDPIALAALVDAAAPAVLDLGVRGSATLELTVHVRGRPAAGWLACRAITRNVIDGYHEEDFEIWDSQGRLVAQSRQLALLPE